MPTYMRRSSNGSGFEFRRGVPKSLQTAIGRTEIKQALGASYVEARRRCNELAVETDLRFAQARGKLKPQAASGARRSEAFYNSLQVIDHVTPELVEQLRAYWLGTVDVADTQRRETGFEHISKAEISAGHAVALPMLRHAWAEGDPSAFIGNLHLTLHMRGYRLASHLLDSDDEKKLAMALVRANMEGLRLLSARDAGDDPPVSLSVPPLAQGATAKDKQVPSRLHKQGGLTLGEAIAAFLANWPSKKKAMLIKHQFLLATFLELTGDVPVVNLRQSHVNAFFRTIQRLPPRWKDLCRQRKIGLAELATEVHPEVISPSTFTYSYKASFNLFLEAAVRDWQDVGFPTTLTTKGITYDGIRKAGEFKQRALAAAELKRLFEGPELEEFAGDEGKVQQYWLPILGLFTGARINELCQINPQQDVRLDQQSGVWHLLLTDEGEGHESVEKSMKTGRSRAVPIHRQLLELGFLKYVDAIKKSHATTLFPQWAPYRGSAGANPGKWFRRFLAQIGLHGAENTAGKALRGAHLFRHTLLTYGKKQGINLRCVSGHAEPSDNRVADGYEDDELLLTIIEKQQRLDALDYNLVLPRAVLPAVKIKQPKR